MKISSDPHSILNLLLCFFILFLIRRVLVCLRKSEDLATPSLQAHMEILAGVTKRHSL